MSMTANSLDQLLSPVQVGAYKLRNRMVMAPLTRSRAGTGDAPTPLIAQYYQQRASAGLIITEASQISPQGKGYPRTPGIHSAAQIAGWRQVTDAVHAEGGRIFLQIWHVGRLSHPSVQPNEALPVAPSALRAEGEIFTAEGLMSLVTPRALELEEIAGVVADFRKAAENAKLAGFDGVEIHAANGYLIDQFLRDGTNVRTDAYGGSIQNCARFLKEVVEAVVPVFGADRVGVRLSPIFNGFSMSDSDPAATFGYAAELLGQYGLAYLHVMQLGEGEFDFKALRQRFNGTYIANGGYDAARAESAIDAGDTDLVSFGTLFLANPDLVNRFRAGSPLNEADRTTFYQGEERGFTDYPAINAA
ncbi:alkene reductase [Paraburkholderia sp. BL10I2N1]|uniref:alkene reductase n=1 Tax=Paraburkholderia sp. BL10I2N1 TaxID=1938796 RepID=UPI001AADD20C|nr:alkene reductase [Paraburkholderia sp. BL10I2N1]